MIGSQWDMGEWAVLDMIEGMYMRDLNKEEPGELSTYKFNDKYPQPLLSQTGELYKAYDNLICYQDWLKTRDKTIKYDDTWDLGRLLQLEYAFKAAKALVIASYPDLRLDTYLQDVQKNVKHKLRLNKDMEPIRTILWREAVPRAQPEEDMAPSPVRPNRSEPSKVVKR